MNELEELHKNLEITNNQISFRLGFNHKIKLKNYNSGHALINSINNITFYAQENFFIVPIKPLKTLWSGTCVHIYDTSKTSDEILDSIIQQFIECEELQNEIRLLNGRYLKKSDIIHKEIYDDWYFMNDKLNTKNKKWVNTYYNEKYKPSNKTKYNNLYLAGAHTNTSFKIWSMESACESGKITSNLILSKYNYGNIYIYKHTKPLISQIINPIDDILYKYNLTSIVNILIFLILVIVVIYLMSFKSLHRK